MSFIVFQFLCFDIIYDYPFNSVSLCYRSSVQNLNLPTIAKSLLRKEGVSNMFREYNNSLAVKCQVIIMQNGQFTYKHNDVVSKVDNNALPIL